MMAHFLCYIDPRPSPHQLKKKQQRCLTLSWTPLTKLSGSAHVNCSMTITHESIAASSDDHFANAFVCKNIVCCFEGCEGDRHL